MNTELSIRFRSGAAPERNYTAAASRTGFAELALLRTGVTRSRSSSSREARARIGRMRVPASYFLPSLDNYLDTCLFPMVLRLHPMITRSRAAMAAVANANSAATTTTTTTATGAQASRPLPRPRALEGPVTFVRYRLGWSLFVRRRLGWSRFVCHRLE